MSQLYEHLFYQADLTDIFNDHALLGYMIRAEVALAQAEAQVGVIPQTAATSITTVLQQGVSLLDLTQLAQETALAGNIAIPLVKQLTAAVHAVDADAARYLHWGATSQDIIDSASVLQSRDALALIEQWLNELHHTTLALAEQYRHQVMIGRTWLQQALPITFGFKAARWASSLQRDLQRLDELKPRVLTVQLGGAVGSLASLADQGSAVVQSYAVVLGLNAAHCTWHAERDRMVELGSFLAIVVGNLGKMARDWSLMMQSEIAELSEPHAAGRGGSSTMPHKRNPVAAASILAASNRVPTLMASLYQSMVQEHERSLGAWHAEWLVLPELFQLCGGALQRTLQVMQGLQLYPEQMHANLELSQGLVMAEAVMMRLAPHLGRLNAHHLVEQACRQALKQQRHLLDVLSEFPEIQTKFSAESMSEMFQAEHYLGNIQAQIDAVLQQGQQKNIADIKRQR